MPNALALMDGVLREAGSDLTRLVQITMLITNPADYAACNAANHGARGKTADWRHAGTSLVTASSRKATSIRV